MYSLPMSTTLAAFTMASAASMEATSPLVSTIPRASIGMTPLRVVSVREPGRILSDHPGQVNEDGVSRTPAAGAGGRRALVPGGRRTEPFSPRGTPAPGTARPGQDLRPGAPADDGARCPDRRGRSGR